MGRALRRHQLLVTVFALCMFNFSVFAIAVLLLGGEAMSGTARDEHYYVGYKGRLTEVSGGTYAFSKYQTRSLVITHPLGMVCAGLLVYKRKMLKCTQPAASLVQFTGRFEFYSPTRA